MRLWRWRRRYRCHHTIWCCQYQDKPMCNGALDPHRLAKAVYLRRQRRMP